MIICHCAGVGHRAVDRAIHGGANTVDEITDACGAGGDCGNCRATLEQRIANEQRVSTTPVRLAFT